MARKRFKLSGADPAYLARERESLKRVHRKTVLFNEKEMHAIDEYCHRFKIDSHSALIRKSVMETVLRALEENHPTLF
ncbi:MAG: hypothetical protein MJY61_01320 [Bacteroidales bacterium]|nr:hypothetical protein [Bacteroidales bacterium]